METPGGRYYAEIDDESPVTREGQLIFFAQLSCVGGRWERLVSNCPLVYKGTRNRGSRVVDVLGTSTLSGMSTTVSEDVVRRAMKRMPVDKERLGKIAARDGKCAKRLCASTAGVWRVVWCWSARSQRRLPQGSRDAGGAIICKPDCPVGPVEKCPSALGRANGLPGVTTLDAKAYPAVALAGLIGNELMPRTSTMSLKPMGLERLYDAEVSSLPTDGQPVALMYNWWHL